MHRGILTITNAKGEVVKFGHVVKFTVKANMIEVVCMREGAQRTTKHGVKGWVSYDFE